MNRIKVTFTGKGGRVGEAEAAKKFLTVGREYDVFMVRVGGFSSTYELFGVSRHFNTTLFSPDTDTVIKSWPVPIKATGTYYFPESVQNDT